MGCVWRIVEPCKNRINFRSYESFISDAQKCTSQDDVRSQRLTSSLRVGWLLSSFGNQVFSNPAKHQLSDFFYSLDIQSVDYITLQASDRPIFISWDSRLMKMAIFIDQTHSSKIFKYFSRSLAFYFFFFLFFFLFFFSFHDLGRNWAYYLYKFVRNYAKGNCASLSFEVRRGRWTEAEVALNCHSTLETLSFYLTVFPLRLKLYRKRIWKFSALIHDYSTLVALYLVFDQYTL